MIQHLTPLMGKLKLHSSGPLYSNAVIGTLAVDKCAVTARRGLSRMQSCLLLTVPYLTAHQRTVYQLHIIQCRTIITFAL